MDKPKEGDILKVKDPERSTGDPGQAFFKVVTVYDHYRFDEPGGDWGSDGEHAWAQKDHDAETGQIGEWYVVATQCDEQGNVLYEGEDMSLGSYEVEPMIIAEADGLAFDASSHPDNLYDDEGKLK